jgi:membrane protease YdiL (CAAX protease family)
MAFFLVVHARETLTAEGWAFQLTLPGLAEELLFRGVIQGIRRNQ